MALKTHLRLEYWQDLIHSTLGNIHDPQPHEKAHADRDEYLQINLLHTLVKLCSSAHNIILCYFRSGVVQKFI